jgi:hypothetical protein
VLPTDYELKSSEPKAAESYLDIELPDVTLAPRAPIESQYPVALLRLRWFLPGQKGCIYL